MSVAEATDLPCSDPLSTVRPSLRTVVQHVACSLVIANVIPAALFSLCLFAGNLTLALASALAWCYGSLAWRMCTRRRTSGLLWLSLLGLTAKSAVVLAGGGTFVYFLQPALGDAVIAAVFLASLLTTRPVIGQLAADFYPMDEELARRPRVRQLFWRLTLLWATLLAVQATVALWLLHSASVTCCAATKSVLGPTAAIAGATVTVLLAARVARLEGLLPVRGTVAAPAG
jgi:hypothetical protein